MSSRYIDADALTEMLTKKLKTDYEMGLYNHGALTESFIRFVERQPTADVVEVRHGYWITRDVRGIETEVKCSVCGSRTYYPAEYPNIRYPDYCGDCGAKMDGKRKDECESKK